MIFFGYELLVPHIRPAEEPDLVHNPILPQLACSVRYIRPSRSRLLQVVVGYALTSILAIVRLPVSTEAFHVSRTDHSDSQCRRNKLADLANTVTLSVSRSVCCVRPVRP